LRQPGSRHIIGGRPLTARVKNARSSGRLQFQTAFEPRPSLVSSTTFELRSSRTEALMTTVDVSGRAFQRCAAVLFSSRLVGHRPLRLVVQPDATGWFRLRDSALADPGCRIGRRHVQRRQRSICAPLTQRAAWPRSSALGFAGAGKDPARDRDFGNTVTGCGCRISGAGSGDLRFIPQRLPCIPAAAKQGRQFAGMRHDERYS